jgi:YfiH family protein
VNLAWLEVDWPAPPGVHAISTFRAGGVSAAPYASLNLGDHVGDSAQAVAENRLRLREAARLPAEPCWLQQVHGVAVRNLDTSEGCPADGAYTRAADRVCAILTADCLPVLLSNESGGTVGAAHAGWRGLSNGVIEATIAAMGVPAHTLLAWLGPAIGPQHFEVGAEVCDAFTARDAGAIAAFKINSRGRFMADLALLARRRLAALGVARIYGGALCTYAESKRYFSHRRDGTTGRQATLIWRQSR